ncbi:hypothetical protein SAMN06269185_2624 [Natronoarchaeum philippinense]|uniref:Uncharacterized protein n=1 Tax=Natronoarchaeum philippinense TaxID=558529 RepID=A0A285P6W5_NATPI|nr:hypothetical protein [Natronoarchaeum philippinense]SNZ15866.1 hypothetical protein SAMN06269185_2624 [Natronoarchaeum philippinense]
MPAGRSSGRRRALTGAVVLAVAIAVVADSAAASNVVSGLQGGSSEVSVPTWLFLVTGGAAIAASGMLSMLVTDRALLATFHSWALSLPSSRTAREWLGRAGTTLTVLVLALVVYTGLAGPQIGSASFAVLVVFVGGRAGLTIVAYAVGNPWPAMDPWRRAAEALPSGVVEYPESLQRWPAVGALLALIWLEVVTPLTQSPSTLAWAVLCYSTLALGAAVAVGPEAWTRNVDPLSAWFRFYGAVGPLQRTDDGWSLRPPGARLRETDLVTDASDVAFVVLLVWELTLSGFVVTPPGETTVRALVGVGLPPAAAYLLLVLVGFALFVGAFRLAARRSRDRAKTYLPARRLAVVFAPSLLAIAGGYHLAHYFAFFVSQTPSLWTAITSPLSPPPPPAFTRFVLPDWFGLLDIGFVLAGHVLAVWAAHAASFDLFPGRLQAIRSQIPFVAVMVGYTMLSLWLLSMPTGATPFVQG